MQDEKQKLFNEIERHLLEDSRPSEYLNGLLMNDLFRNEHPFRFLARLSKVEQSPKHHPEGNVWNHTMLVVDNAAQVKSKSSNIRVFMWAALLHDIGKATTTRLRKGRITSYDHDKEGEKLVHEFFKGFTDDEDFIEKVAKMARWHMQILFVTNKLPFQDIKTMKSETDVNEIALLGFCDRMGRGMEQDAQKEIDTMEHFIKVCHEV